MSIQNARKIGFVAALCMLLGSVIGIGIFFKNSSVSKAVAGDGATWLAAWIVGGILSTAAAFNFSEIGFFKNSKLTGLANWSHKSGGKLYGYFVTFNWSFFYYSLLTLIIGYYGADVFFFILSQLGANISGVNLIHRAIIGLGITVFYIALNFISIKAVGIWQTITTVLKFIPLIASVLVGIIYFNVHNAKGSNAFVDSNFNFSNMVIALPAVLFAYDSFIGVGSLGMKVKNAEKNISIIVIAGMISVVMLYSLIAVSSILHNQGSIAGLFGDSLAPEMQKGAIATVYIFLLISTLGVINGITSVFVSEMEQQQRVAILFGIKSLKNKLGERNTTLVLIFVSLLFWILLTWIPAMIMSNDGVLDGVANFPTVFFFIIYATTILLYTIKRLKNKKELKTLLNSSAKFGNDILFYVSAFVAVVGIFVGIGATFVVVFQKAINGIANESSWGAFVGIYGDGVKILQKNEIWFYLIATLLFFGLPLLNWALVKFVNKVDLVKEFDEIVEEKENTILK